MAEANPNLLSSFGFEMPFLRDVCNYVHPGSVNFNVLIFLYQTSDV